MASFATPQQMEQRSQGAIAATHPFLETELASATRSIRDYCGWHIAGPEEVTHRRVRPYHDQVWLPAMQVEEIVSAKINGGDVEPDTVEFDPDTGWTSLYGRRVEVKFRAGFDSVPESLVTLTLELAAGALGTPLGISREQAGGVSVTFARTSGALLVGPGGADIARLAPYKLGVLP